MDLLLTLIFLPLFAILALLVSVWIWLDSGRPIIYKSKRVGKYAKEFTLYKFRTMTGTDTGKDAINSKLQSTRAGSFLRRSRMDELPQIFNILKGEMSFVGPRPEIPELSQIYEKEIPLYHLRFRVLPGLSGWAQLNHQNHPHHGIDVLATKEKLSYDLFYLAERSTILDLSILIQTALLIIGLKGK
jgi:lipopolysaccharide/colanic/teichoic acid biosynthesis glycosyltransferase